MKKVFSILAIVLLVVSVVGAADVRIRKEHSIKDFSVRQFSATGAGNITASVDPTASGTTSAEIWEVISIRLHLSAAGAANDLTVTVNNALGSAYDTVIITQDMTSAVNLYQTYGLGEMVMDEDDTLDFAWTNGSTRTYGLEVLYRLK